MKHHLTDDDIRLVALISRDLPQRSIRQTIDDVRALKRAARAIQRIHEAMTSEPGGDSEFNRRALTRLFERAEAIALERLGAAEVRLESDPRGAPLYLTFPAGHSNGIVHGQWAFS